MNCGTILSSIIFPRSWRFVPFLFSIYFLGIFNAWITTMNKQKGFLENLEKVRRRVLSTTEEGGYWMTKSMKAVRDRKTDNRRISQNMEKAFKKMAQVFGYPSREYKDRVFRMLLKEPKVALEVYNAMNGTSYDNPDDWL